MYTVLQLSSTWSWIIISTKIRLDAHRLPAAPLAAVFHAHAAACVYACITEQQITESRTRQRSNTDTRTSNSESHRPLQYIVIIFKLISTAQLHKNSRSRTAARPRSILPAVSVTRARCSSSKDVRPHSRLRASLPLLGRGTGGHSSSASALSPLKSAGGTAAPTPTPPSAPVGPAAASAAADTTTIPCSSPPSTTPLLQPEPGRLRAGMATSPAVPLPCRPPLLLVLQQSLLPLLPLPPRLGWLRTPRSCPPPLRQSLGGVGGAVEVARERAGVNPLGSGFITSRTPSLRLRSTCSAYSMGGAGRWGRHSRVGWCLQGLEPRLVGS